MGPGSTAIKGLYVLPAASILACGQRMMIEHEVFQPLIQHMRVNLGSRQISMAQHDLDRPQICPTRQKMGSKGMAQSMRGHFGWRDTGLSGKLFDQKEKKPCRER